MYNLQNPYVKLNDELYFHSAVVSTPAYILINLPVQYANYYLTRVIC